MIYGTEKIRLCKGNLTIPNRYLEFFKGEFILTCCDDCLMIMPKNGVCHNNCLNEKEIDNLIDLKFYDVEILNRKIKLNKEAVLEVAGKEKLYMLACGNHVQIMKEKDMNKENGNEVGKFLEKSKIFL